MLFIDHCEQSESNMLPSAFAAKWLLFRFEYPSLVTMEAMLARTSVAMSDGGIAKDVFKDFVQYFNPHSPSDMRDTIMNAYAQSHKQSHIEDAYHYAYDTFSWASDGPQIEEVYQRILKKSKQLKCRVSFSEKTDSQLIAECCTRTPQAWRSHSTT